LRQALSARFGIRHVVLTSTGRAGLTVLLRALRRLSPERTEVILPAFTCYSVAASVVKAGLAPRLVDVDPATLDFAPDALERADFSRVLAVVATNLYGMPSALPALTEIARRHGAFVVDDAAQAMGASVGGKWSGTLGDAGLYSFDKGKNVAAIDGGAIVTGSDEIAVALAQEHAGLPTSSESGAKALAKALAYSVLLRPWLYWIPNSVPQLGLGTTRFTTDFHIEQPPRALVALALTMLDRLDAFTQARTANAARLIEGLASVPGVRPVAPQPGAKAVYLRLPVLVDDPDARDGAIARLNAAGIGASGSYPASIADIPELQPWANRARAAAGGQDIARRLITLPTHSYVGAADVARAVSVLAGSLELVDCGPVRPASAR
jgi:perosamine synthetase